MGFFLGFILGSASTFVLVWCAQHPNETGSAIRRAQAWVAGLFHKGG